GQRGVGAPGQLAYRLSVRKFGVVVGILRAARRLKHPVRGAFLPLCLPRVTGKQQGASGQTAGSPGVLFGLGIVVDAGTRRHLAKPGKVIGGDGGQQGTLFIAQQVVEQRSGDSHAGNGAAALAFTEEALASFAPFGASRFGTSPTFLRANTVGRARVM